MNRHTTGWKGTPAKDRTRRSRHVRRPSWHMPTSNRWQELYAADVRENQRHVDIQSIMPKIRLTDLAALGNVAPR
jgi:hypothetical protein